MRISKHIRFVSRVLFNFTSLEYVKENATEVAQIGQMYAAFKSLENKESHVIIIIYILNTFLSNSLHFVHWIIGGGLFFLAHGTGSDSEQQ